MTRSKKVLTGIQGSKMAALQQTLMLLDKDEGVDFLTKKVAKTENESPKKLGTTSEDKQEGTDTEQTINKNSQKKESTMSVVPQMKKEENENISHVHRTKPYNKEHSLEEAIDECMKYSKEVTNAKQLQRNKELMQDRLGNFSIKDDTVFNELPEAKRNFKDANQVLKDGTDKYRSTRLQMSESLAQKYIPEDNIEAETLKELIPPDIIKTYQEAMTPLPKLQSLGSPDSINELDREDIGWYAATPAEKRQLKDALPVVKQNKVDTLWDEHEKKYEQFIDKTIDHYSNHDNILNIDPKKLKNLSDKTFQSRNEVEEKVSNYFDAKIFTMQATLNNMDINEIKKREYATWEKQKELVSAQNNFTKAMVEEIERNYGSLVHGDKPETTHGHQMDDIGNDLETAGDKQDTTHGDYMDDIGNALDTAASQTSSTTLDEMANDLDRAVSKMTSSTIDSHNNEENAKFEVPSTYGENTTAHQGKKKPKLPLHKRIYTLLDQANALIGLPKRKLIDVLKDPLLKLMSNEKQQEEVEGEKRVPVMQPQETPQVNVSENKISNKNKNEEALDTQNNEQHDDHHNKDTIGLESRNETEPVNNEPEKDTVQQEDLGDVEQEKNYICPTERGVHDRDNAVLWKKLRDFDESKAMPIDPNAKINPTPGDWYVFQGTGEAKDLPALVHNDQYAYRNWARQTPNKNIPENYYSQNRIRTNFDQFLACSDKFEKFVYHLGSKDLYGVQFRGDTTGCMTKAQLAQHTKKKCEERRERNKLIKKQLGRKHASIPNILPTLPDKKDLTTQFRPTPLRRAEATYHHEPSETMNNDKIGNILKSCKKSFDKKELQCAKSTFLKDPKPGETYAMHTFNFTHDPGTAKKTREEMLWFPHTENDGYKWKTASKEYKTFKDDKGKKYNCLVTKYEAHSNGGYAKDFKKEIYYDYGNCTLFIDYTGNDLQANKKKSADIDGYKLVNPQLTTADIHEPPRHVKKNEIPKGQLDKENIDQLQDKEDMDNIEVEIFHSVQEESAPDTKTQHEVLFDDDIAMYHSLKSLDSSSYMEVDAGLIDPISTLTDKFARSTSLEDSFELQADTTELIGSDTETQQRFQDNNTDKDSDSDTDNKSDTGTVIENLTYEPSEGNINSNKNSTSTNKKDGKTDINIKDKDNLVHGSNQQIPLTNDDDNNSVDLPVHKKQKVHHSLNSNEHLKSSEDFSLKLQNMSISEELHKSEDETKKNKKTGGKGIKVKIRPPSNKMGDKESKDIAHKEKDTEVKKKKKKMGQKNNQKN